jgi:hypothetical protein
MQRRACSKCGSRKFGSARVGGALTRQCHGYIRQPGATTMHAALPCKVSWPESDDWKHFETEDGRSFMSEAAYEAELQRFNKRFAAATAKRWMKATLPRRS